HKPYVKAPSRLPSTEEVEERVKVERHVVTSRPMLARYSKGKAPGIPGRSYPSHTTLERLWSDNTLDYICAYAKCDQGPDGGPFQSENPLSVRGHWRYHVDRGQVPKEESQKRFL